MHHLAQLILCVAGCEYVLLGLEARNTYSSRSLFFTIYFEKGLHQAKQSGLEFAILLIQPPELLGLQACTIIPTTSFTFLTCDCVLQVTYFGNNHCGLFIFKYLDFLPARNLHMWFSLPELLPTPFTYVHCLSSAFRGGM